MVLASVDELVLRAVSEAVSEIHQQPGLPRVHSTRSCARSDSTGEPGVWVWLVLDDPPAGGHPRTVQDAIRETVLRCLDRAPGRSSLADSVYLTLLSRSEVEAARRWRDDMGGL